MAKTRSSGRGRKKKSSSRGNTKDNKTSGKGSSKKSKQKTDSESDTSPFKGFDESTIPSTLSPDKENLISKKLFEDNVEDDKNAVFDRLINSEYKSSFINKNVRTYSNKRKHIPEGSLLEFQDSKNRDSIVQWLNDNRNAFDRLTQTQYHSEQCNYGNDDVTLTLDMPSVSQINTKLNRSNDQNGRRTKRSPYKLRARSLDIRIKKNVREGRSKRHSLAGDAPSMENYHIEETVTDEEAPVPAEKIIVDLMEDEYLDKIEKEMLQQKSTTGWKRIKDFNKTINCTKKKLKQLDITLQCSQNKRETTGNRVYNFNELEDFYLENIEKIMNVERNEMYSQSVVKTQVESVSIRDTRDAGNTFITLLKKLSKQNLTDFKPMFVEIEQLFRNSNNKFEATTQTSVLVQVDEAIQTEISTVNAQIQTEIGTVNEQIQTEISTANAQIQTEISTINAQIQTDDFYTFQNCVNNNIIMENKELPDLATSDKTVQNACVQTDLFINKKFDVHVQTEQKIDTEVHTASVSRLSSASAVHSESLINAVEKMITPSEDCDLDKSLDDVCFNTEDFLKEEGGQKFETLDVCFNTKDILEEDNKKEEVEKAAVVESSTSKGVKRLNLESPVRDSERFCNKRPCNKFINEDLSVNFESCAETENIETEKKNIQFSEDSDDLDAYDNYLEEVMRKFDNNFSKKPQPNPSPIIISRTQEDLEKLEDVIRNVTKPKSSAGPNNNQQSYSSSESDVIFVQAEINMTKIEDDFDYFKTDKTPKSSRKNLFDTKPNQKFSESIFFSDNEETSGEFKENRTITQDNVDQVVQAINRNSRIVNSEVDEEVQEILTPKTPKINILQNVVVKSADKVVEHLTPTECDQDTQSDIIEATPQKKYSSRSERRCASMLDITLPPPLEFQDTEAPNESLNNTTLDVSFQKSSPRRHPLAVINKITSTPVSQKQASESISLSPITLEKKRNLGPIEIAQRQKCLPLTIVKRTSSQKSSQSTPKQKSILNYVRSSQESSQKSPTGKRKPCVACTRITRDEVMGLTSLANKRLVTYSSCFTPNVTHMIVSVNDRNRMTDHTIKSVSAIAGGIWLLNYGWIRECLAKNCLVSEEPYEVLDINGVPGPKTSRLQRLANPLLKGYKIHAAPPFSTTSQQGIENIVKMLGGEVVSIIDGLMDKDDYIKLIIAEATATQDCDFHKFDTWLEIFGVLIVDLEWLSRSVSQYSLQPLRPFILCSDDNIDSLGYSPELLDNVSVSFIKSTSSVPSL